MAEKNFLFVYGILKGGFPANYILRSSNYVGKFYVDGFKMYDLGQFPAVVRGKGMIYGEVYEVNDGVLAMCDDLEGVPNFYKRETMVPFKPVINFPVNIYVINRLPVHAKRIKGGVWHGENKNQHVA